MTKESKAVKDKHDAIFRKMIEADENKRGILELSLPKPIFDSLDLSHLELDETQYVDDRFKRAFSEHVIKTRIKTETDSEIDEAEFLETDIYILFEHKSMTYVRIFVQLLIYMCMMWERDLDNGKPLRMIIPIVFYHGKDDWDMPVQFKDQFNVKDEIKDYLLNFEYILFDTKNWQLDDECNDQLKDHVYLMTALSFMKNAFNNDLESVLKIFRLWKETGFVDNTHKVLFLLTYISEAKKLSREKVIDLLEKSDIDGGEAMQTWVDELREEVTEKVREEVREEVTNKVREEVTNKVREEVTNKVRDEERVEGKREVAVGMLKKGLDIGIVSEVTGFSREEIEKLAERVH